MAYELVEEVFSNAPDMTAAERLILLAIAERSRVGERAATIDGAEMLRRCCLDERGLRHALSRLAERGFEVRLEFGRDRRGRPVYAVPGRPRVFTLPHFTPAAGDCRCRRCRQADFLVPLPMPEPAKEDLQGRQADVEVRLGGPTGPSGGRGSPPIQSVEIPSVSRAGARAPACVHGLAGVKLDGELRCPQCRADAIAGPLVGADPG